MKLQQTLGGALVAALSLLTLPAHAVGTPAGTNILNTASVDYDLGAGVVTANSNTTDFEVDRQIDLTVDEVDGDYRLVVNGDTNEYLTFTVTNTGNSNQDFALAATDIVNGNADPHGGTDNFDETVSVFVDSNGNNVYDSGVDVATYIEDLAPGTPVTVFIVAPTIAGTATAPDISAHTLTATAHGNVDANGAYVQTAGLDTISSETNVGAPDVANFIDTLFIDDPADGTGARDGADADTDAFQVVNAVLTVVKTATVISDPINGFSANAKAIPGAIVRYVIEVTNNTPDTANSVAFSDTLDANLLYEAGTLLVDPDGTGLVAEDDDFVGAGDASGVNNLGTQGSEEVVTDFGDSTLLTGQTAKVQFNVEIQ